jgi:hypothetical protein
LPPEETEDKPKHFFNVDRVKSVFESQSNHPPKRLTQRITGRARNILDSLSGLLTAFLGMLVLFGTFSSVIVGIIYGPLAFLVVIGSSFGLLALYLNRKVGKSLQFGDYSISKGLAAQIIGLSIGLGFFVSILFLLPALLPK